jgi:hypothetical protein
MFNLDRQRIDIECPRCRFRSRVFLRQIRLCDVIVCGGCKGNIRLVDHMSTFRKADRRIGAAVDGLISTLRNFRL